MPRTGSPAGVCGRGVSSVLVFPRLTAPGRPPRYMPEWEAAAELKQDVMQPLKPGQPVETKVGGLKHRAEYQFRVIAVNKAGNSPESEATDYHLVKHRARECPPYRGTFPIPVSPTYSPIPFPPPSSLSCTTGVPCPLVSLCFLALPMFLGPYLLDRPPVTSPLCSTGCIRLSPALSVIWAAPVYLTVMCLPEYMCYCLVACCQSCCMCQRPM